jgi:hypothetical protein
VMRQRYNYYEACADSLDDSPTLEEDGSFQGNMLALQAMDILSADWNLSGSGVLRSGTYTHTEARTHTHTHTHTNTHTHTHATAARLLRP